MGEEEEEEAGAPPRRADEEEGGVAVGVGLVDDGLVGPTDDEDPASVEGVGGARSRVPVASGTAWAAGTDSEPPFGLSSPCAAALFVDRPMARQRKRQTTAPRRTRGCLDRMYVTS
jgi:hypothetical protein